MWRTTACLLTLAMTLACAPEPTRAPTTLKVAPDIVTRRAQFVQKVLDAEVSHLKPGDRLALARMVEAAAAVDEVFRLQAWAGNPTFAPQVAALEGPDAAAARDYYRIMVGPWDRLRDWEPFLGEGARPRGAGFYPEDLTEVELNAWLAANPQDRQALVSPTTVIRRDGAKLVAVPYSTAYRDQLSRAATALRAAAAAAENASLKRFLELRAEAFLSDDYYASDLAWMDLDSEIEVVIGPYETYEDNLLGYKAAFETFLCVAQPEDSAALARYKQTLPFLESSLPIPEQHKNRGRGSESPIRVADELLTSGDARAGVQTLAFNLPNDERVREAKGSKKVLLKNIMQAKYEAILEPIAGLVLPEDQTERISFDAYFHHILFHELAHGLGPGRITVSGRQTEARLELKELYSAIEEAKADVVGALSLYWLARRGEVPATAVETQPWTFTAGLFRSARFGTTEAHGLGVLIQTNYLLEKGAIEITPDGRFRPVPDRFEGALSDLAHELLMVEALGSYDGAKTLVQRYGTVRPEMGALLAKLSSIPVDIDPVYPLAGLS
jgi:hypothetical protein